MLKQLALLLILSATSHAAALVTYDFSELASDSQFRNPANPNAESPYSGISRGDYILSINTLDPVPLLAGGVTNPWDGNVLAVRIKRGGSPVAGYTNMNTLNQAISYGSYFDLAYTPAGETAFSSITFDAAGSSGAKITLRSSVTGTVNLGEALISTSPTLNTGGQQAITFDLSSISALQDVSSPVTFTFYMDTNGSNNHPTVYIDDLTINGTQSIPEPSSLGLIAVAGSALFLRRRKRHS